MADAALEGASAYNVRQQGLNQALLDERKTKAYNALHAIYGDIAGDPASAQADQNYLTATQQDPLRTQSLALANAGTGIANDQASENLDLSRKVDPLKVIGAGQEIQQGDIKTQADQLGLDTARVQDPLKTQGLAIANQGANIANQGGTISNNAAANTLAVQRGAQERQAASGLLATLNNAYTTGGDLGATFDSMAPQIAAFEGVDPAHLQPLKEMLLRDPKGTIDKLTQAIAATAPPTAAGRPGSAAAAANTPQARNSQADALDVIHERTAAVPATIDAALALLQQMPHSAIVRKATENIPGYPAYKFNQLVHSISSNLSLDDLRSLRQSGLSLGRTNIAEFQASANAFANLDLGQDPAQIMSALTRLKGSYGQINSNIQADITRLRTGANANANAPPQKATGGISYGAVTNFLSKTYGITPEMIASEGRDAAANRRAGGVNGSAHTQRNSDGTLGKAIDFTPPGKPWTQADLDNFAAELDRRGIPHTELLIEKKGDKNSTGYHVHWGWAPKNGKPGGDTAPLSDADLLKKYGL